MPPRHLMKVPSGLAGELQCSKYDTFDRIYTMIRIMKSGEIISFSILKILLILSRKRLCNSPVGVDGLLLFV